MSIEKYLEIPEFVDAAIGLAIGQAFKAGRDYEAADFNSEEMYAAMRLEDAQYEPLRAAIMRAIEHAEKGSIEFLCDGRTD